MIRVLQIGLGSNPGGIENCIMNYYRAIDHTKFQFDFVDIYGKGLVYEDEIKNLGGKVYHLTSYKKAPQRMAMQLKKIIRENEYKIIHINMLSAANMIPVLVSCNYKKAKVIVHSHNSAVPKGWVRKILNKINIYFLRKFPIEKWGCGKKAGNWMWGKQFKNENIVFNAVDIEKFQKNSFIRNQIKTQCGFLRDDKIIGFVGRLSEQKNPLFLIDIIKELRNYFSNVKLLIVGDGDLRCKMEEKIENLGLKNLVYFAGVQKNVNDWYQAMDLFVLPSLFEGLPVVGIEAQANELPCFISDRVTTEINLTGTVTYLPIDKGADIWATAMSNVLTKKQERKIIFPKQYQIQYAIKKLENKYIKLINEVENASKF